MAEQSSQAGTHQLLAVIYSFEVRIGGERRMVTEDGVSASTLAMLAPQLNAGAKRTRVAQGPGLVVFDNYQDARQAAQAIASIATHVEVCEVAAVTGGAAEGWPTADGTRYRAVPGGVAQIVKD
ncbi:MAG TPA: hypothetical protein VIL85_01840 [Thermomicrobiales bacterium]|jgi:hypothetical protein